MTDGNVASALLVRAADPGGRDSVAIRRLVEVYLRQTELEKAQHLSGLDHPHDVNVPERYREEVEYPDRAYRSAVVHLAEIDRAPVGVVVMQPTADAREIKRLWVDPTSRGRRVGSTLLDTALRGADLPTRLTVWDWRRDAIALYQSRGFVVVPSWEERPRLVCMERAPIFR